MTFGELLRRLRGLSEADLNRPVQIQFGELILGVLRIDSEVGTGTVRRMKAEMEAG